jgi:hypothetical protein
MKELRMSDIDWSDHRFFLIPGTKAAPKSPVVRNLTECPYTERHRHQGGKGGNIALRSSATKPGCAGTDEEESPMKFYGKAEESAKVILDAFRHPNSLPKPLAQPSRNFLRRPARV